MNFVTKLQTLHALCYHTRIKILKYPLQLGKCYYTILRLKLVLKKMLWCKHDGLDLTKEGIDFENDGTFFQVCSVLNEHYIHFASKTLTQMAQFIGGKREGRIGLSYNSCYFFYGTHEPTTEHGEEVHTKRMTQTITLNMAS